MKKESFIQWNNRILGETFSRINYKIFISFIIDASFYAIAFFAFGFWYQRIIEKMYSMNIPGPDQLAAMGQASANEALAQATHFYYALVISLILLILALIFLFSIASSLIWSFASGKKPTIRSMSRFLILEIIWAPGWILLIFLISKYAQLNYVPVFMAIVLIVSYFTTTILHSLFIRTEKLNSIKTAFKIGFGKIRFYALPFASFLVLVYIVSVLARFVNFKYTMAAYFSILILIACLYRYYFYSISNSLKSAL